MINQPLQHHYFSGESDQHYFPGFFPFKQSAPPAPSINSNNSSHFSSDYSSSGNGNSGDRKGGSSSYYSGNYSGSISVSTDGGRTWY